MNADLGIRFSFLNDLSQEWTSCEAWPDSGYRSNLVALSKRCPGSAERLQACHPALELRRSEQGYTEARDAESGEELVISARNPQSEKQRIHQWQIGALPREIASVVWILGMDVERTLTGCLTHFNEASQKIAVVVEPDLRYLFLVMHGLDLSVFLRSNRFLWALGPDALSEAQELYQSHYLFASPRDEVFPSCSAAVPSRRSHWQQLSSALQQWKPRCQQRFDVSLAEAGTYYATHQPERITRILAPSLESDQGMAVRYIQSRFLEECERLGVQVQTHAPGFRSDMILLGQIAAFRPDLLLFVNKLPGEYCNADTLNSLGVPRMIWLIDDPNCFVGSVLHQRDIVFTWDQAYDRVLREHGATTVDFFPYVADLDNAKPVVREEFASPISYIGQVKALNPEELGLDSVEAEFARFIGVRKAEQIHCSYNELVFRHQHEFGLTILDTVEGEIPRFLRYGMYVVANALRRVDVLESVRPFGLKLYGNPDWQVVLQGHPLLECFQGPADPQQDVPDIFLSSTINLNIHSLQALTSLNQRDYNCPLVGGFLLTDWVQGADQFFIPDEEMVFYRSLDDLKQKVQYFLTHEEERQACIRRGRDRVKREHTYAQRVPDVLNTLVKRIQKHHDPSDS